MKPYRKKLLESDKSNIRILIEMGLSEKEVLRICKVKIEDLSIEDLEAKMKKIYDDNRVLIEGEYTVAKES